MLLRFTTLSLVLIALLAPALPARGAAPATASHELRAKGGGRVWVYLPPNVPAAAKVACVVVPPAGSRMFHGMLLEDGDRREHHPYVEAGFAVVAFDISGPWQDTNSDAALKKAAADFKTAQFGVTDALDALQVALARYPQIDPKRVYVAGHSSAATLALQVAASSDQFRGCAAYAPVLDVAAHLDEALAVLDRLVPDFAKAIRLASPNNRIAAIRGPVFLFHALDDEGTSPQGMRAFKDALVARGLTVEYVSVKSGGHYDSMIDEGLPKAIAWLKALDEKSAGR